MPLDSLADAVLPRADDQRPGRDAAITSSSSACRSTPSAPGGRSSARAAEQGADAGACAVLLRELEALAERLAAADVRVVGALRPGMLARRDPRRVRPLVAAGPRAARRPPTPTATASTRPPPGRSAPKTSWDAYRTDGAVHATYWIASWPRVDVGAAFLSPLLLHAQMVRAIAVTIEPISPLRAIREVEAARTSDVADRELRGRMGFIETARRRRQTEAVAAPRGGARRRARRRALRRLRHRLRAHARGARARLLRDRARRPDGPARAAPPLRPAGRRRSPTRCRSAGGCGEGAGASPATAPRPRTSRPRTRSSPRAGSAAAASTSAATSTAAPSATTPGSCTAAS